MDKHKKTDCHAFLLWFVRQKFIVMIFGVALLASAGVSASGQTFGNDRGVASDGVPMPMPQSVAWSPLGTPLEPPHLDGMGVPPGLPPMDGMGVPPGQPPMNGMDTPQGQPPMNGMGVPPGLPPMDGMGVPPGPPPMNSMDAPPGQPPMNGMDAPPGQPPMNGMAVPPGQPPMNGMAVPPGPPPMNGMGVPPGPPPMDGMGAPPGPPPGNMATSASFGPKKVNAGSFLWMAFYTAVLLSGLASVSHYRRKKPCHTPVLKTQISTLPRIPFREEISSVPLEVTRSSRIPTSTGIFDK